MRTRNLTLALVLLTGLASVSQAQRLRGLIPDLYKSGNKTRTAFSDVVKDANQSTVKIFSDGKHTAMGAVVDKNGFVLTKASELSGQVEVQTSDGNKHEAEVVGVQNTHDLAMLKVDFKLKPIKWSSATKAIVGEWVATSGWGSKPISVGVVSTPRRAIPKRPGALGIRAKMIDKNGRQEFAPGAVIGEVYKNSAAADAGLKVDDQIVQVNGKKVNAFPDLAQTVRKFGPGDVLKLRVKRGDETFDVDVELSTMSVLPMMQNNRGAIQNRMGGKLSNRRYGFPAVFQHDTVLKPEQCGGPLVNLKGEAIGLNIARGGRVETYAIPFQIIKPLLKDLKSGKLAPPKGLATLKPVEKKEDSTKQANQTDKDKKPNTNTGEKVDDPPKPDDKKPTSQDEK